MKYAHKIPSAAVACVLAVLPFMGAGCVPFSVAKDGEEIAPTGTVTERVAPSDSEKASKFTVTMDELGKTIRLGVGDKFLLKLPENLDWTEQSSDASVLAQDDGSRIAHGALVTFRTFRAGKASLAAQGDAPCRKAATPCSTPPEFFKVDFIVTP